MAYFLPQPAHVQHQALAIAARIAAAGAYVTHGAVAHELASFLGPYGMAAINPIYVPVLALLARLQHVVDGFVSAFIDSRAIATLRDLEDELGTVLRSFGLPPLAHPVAPPPAADPGADPDEIDLDDDSVAPPASGPGAAASFREYGLGPLHAHPLVRLHWHLAAGAPPPAFSLAASDVLRIVREDAVSGKLPADAHTEQLEAHLCARHSVWSTRELGVVLRDVRPIILLARHAWRREQELLAAAFNTGQRPPPAPRQRKRARKSARPAHSESARLFLRALEQAVEELDGQPPTDAQLRQAVACALREAAPQPESAEGEVLPPEPKDSDFSKGADGVKDDDHLSLVGESGSPRASETGSGARVEDAPASDACEPEAESGAAAGAEGAGGAEQPGAGAGSDGLGLSGAEASVALDILVEYAQRHLAEGPEREHSTARADVDAAGRNACSGDEQQHETPARADGPGAHTRPSGAESGPPGAASGAGPGVPALANGGGRPEAGSGAAPHDGFSMLVERPHGGGPRAIGNAQLQTCLPFCSADRGQADDSAGSLRAAGRWGEQLVYQHLLLSTAGAASVRWLNEETESGLGYDIEVRQGGKLTYVEVKSTRHARKNVFHISAREWELARKMGSGYHIYRVYAAMDPGRVSIEHVADPARMLESSQIALCLAF